MDRRGPQSPDPSIAQPLRAGAHGLYAAEAGTELLIRHATWLQRSDFRDRYIEVDTSITGDTKIANIDWPAAIAALNSGRLHCSGGEERMLRLAASLIDGTHISLRDTLIGLDGHNLDLVTQAVLHINGRPQPHR